MKMIMMENQRSRRLHQEDRRWEEKRKKPSTKSMQTVSGPAKEVWKDTAQSQTWEIGKDTSTPADQSERPEKDKGKSSDGD